jgi:hypothetical protein
VHHEENGFLIQPGDSQAMAGYLDTLLSNEELRQEMGQASLRIIADHDRNAVLDQWEEIYRRLALEFREVRERKQHLRSMRRHSARNQRRSITFIQHLPPTSP